jgi:hypothetical protein
VGTTNFTAGPAWFAELVLLSKSCRDTLAASYTRKMAAPPDWNLLVNTVQTIPFSVPFAEIVGVGAGKLLIFESSATGVGDKSDP